MTALFWLLNNKNQPTLKLNQFLFIVNLRPIYWSKIRVSFFYHFSCQMLLAHIIQSFKVCCNSKTLIDIFRNAHSIDSTSGNVTIKMPGHLSQSGIVASTFSNSVSCNWNLYEGKWTSFVKENIIFDYYVTGLLFLCFYQLDQNEENSHTL